MLHAVIMAGGAGTRFWPASRRDCPKQLLNLFGDRSMIRWTVDRLGGLVSPERTLVVTNASLVEPISRQLPELPEGAIVGEPAKRDTAPCIGLAALLVSQNDPQATMAVMPADHVISSEEKFQQSIQLAGDLIDQAAASGNSQRIVTFGIEPGYPAETFGYIQCGEEFQSEQADEQAPPIFRVLQFQEKPSADVAREYLAAGNYFWNSGIFVWRASTILDALRERQPEMFARLQTIGQAIGTPEYPAVLQREFTAISGISIDYAVMEHAQDVLVIQAPFDWDDVGSWRALPRLQGEDEQGNTIAARHLGDNTHGCIIRGEDGHLIVTQGVKDLIIVQTPQATLVAHKDDEESIRNLVKQIQEQGWEEYL